MALPQALEAKGGRHGVKINQNKNIEDVRLWSHIFCVGYFMKLTT